jgi:hypothetical protein
VGTPGANRDLPPALREIVDEIRPQTTSALRIGTIPAWSASPVNLIGEAFI